MITLYWDKPSRVPNGIVYRVVLDGELVRETGKIYCIIENLKENQEDEKMSEFKICLIGCGGMTKSGHGPSCKKYAEEHDGVVLAACCDIDIEKAQNACEVFGFQRAYTDYIEMVEKECPDVVLAITPVHLTEQISVALLERRIPVFLEKPPGMDAEQNMRIHEAAIRNNTPARVAFNRRYTPLVQALKEEIKAAGAQLLDINCMFVRVNRKDADFSTTAIHGIDTVKYIADSEYADAKFYYHDICVADKKVTNIQMSAVMENGASASLTFLPCGGCVVERITVTLTGYTFFLYLPVWGGADAPGELVCFKEKKVYKRISGDDLVKQYTLHESNGFYAESQVFFDELRAGKRPKSDVISGKSSVEIARCIRTRQNYYSR